MNAPDDASRMDTVVSTRSEQWVLTLTSPHGGPTVVIVQLPLTTAAPAPTVDPTAELPASVAAASASAAAAVPKKPRARKSTS